MKSVGYDPSKPLNPDAAKAEKNGEVKEGEEGGEKSAEEKALEGGALVAGSGA